MKYLAITLSLIKIFLFFSFSQEIPEQQVFKTIEYDENTRFFKGSFPVDRAFNIKIKNPIEFDYLLLIKHCGKKSLCESLEPSRKSCKSIKNLTFFPNELIWEQKEGENEYLYIQFRYLQEEDINFQLRPNSTYSLLMFKNDERVFDLIKDYYRIQDSSLKIQSFSQRETYESSQRAEIITEFSSLQNESHCLGILIPKAEDFINSLERNPNLRTYFLSKFKEFQSAPSEFSISSPGSDFYSDPEIYSHLTRFLFEADSAALKRISINISTLFPVLINFIEKDIIYHKGLFSTKFSKKNLEKINNYNRDIKDLVKLIQIYQIENEHKIPLGYVDYLTKLKNEIHELIDTIKLKHENREKIKKEIFDYIFSPSPIALNKLETYSFSFDERLKLRFTPDLGIINYGFQPNFNDVSPYLGFHYNLTYLDRDIPFHRTYGKSIWDYLSISLGWTLNSIEKEGRREGLIQNGSIMTGVGVRINHTFRLNVGRNWFFRIEENPISDRKIPSSTFYTGLSIDYQVYELFNGFSGLFKK